jgi:hypothetical protein
LDLQTSNNKQKPNQKPYSFIDHESTHKIYFYIAAYNLCTVCCELNLSTLRNSYIHTTKAIVKKLTNKTERRVVELSFQVVQCPKPRLHLDKKV